MKKISSSATIFYKKLFPLLWFGFLTLFVGASVLGEAANKDPMFYIVPCLMAAFGFFLMKKLIWDLADEVYDGGDFLLVKSQGKEERVALSNVMNVSASTNMNPPRITLHLVTPGRIGREISFSPESKFSINPFAKNEIAEDLMVRVDRAKRNRVL